MPTQNSSLLLDEYPLILLPSLACTVGINGALVLQQIHYWIIHNTKAEDPRYFKDGSYWTRVSYVEWRRKNFPFWSIRTIKRIVRRLIKDNLIVQKFFDDEPAAYYQIAVLALRECQVVTPPSDNLSPPPSENPSQNLDPSLQEETNIETKPKNADGEYSLF